MRLLIVHCVAPPVDVVHARAASTNIRHHPAVPHGHAFVTVDMVQYPTYRDFRVGRGTGFSGCMEKYGVHAREGKQMRTPEAAIAKVYTRISCEQGQHKRA